MRVAITGMASWSALGRNLIEFERRLRAGESGVRPVTRMDVSHPFFRSRSAAVLGEEETEIHWFDPEDPDHLRKFYDRVTACFEKHPGGLIRTIGGYHLAMTNDVFDPDADTYEWHPTLKEAVANRQASPPSTKH